MTNTEGLAALSVRKTGGQGYPWEARCKEHRYEETYLVPGVGAVAFNTRGVGNRLWQLAMLSAAIHHNRHHATETTTREGDL